MGIDLPRDIGTPALPWSRLRRIVSYLPEDSATARARRDHGPTLETQFLRSIEHDLRILAWQQTKDGSKGTNPPKPVSLRGDVVQGGVRRDSLALDALLAERKARRQAELQGIKEGT